MKQIKLVAFDLDCTLLTTDKRLTPENEAALRAAAEAGIELVPATGRFYRAVPDCVRSLPYIRYMININGALIYDVKNGCALHREDMPWQPAAEIMRRLDELPVLYDCYQSDRGWISGSWQERCEPFAVNPAVLRMFRNERTAVPDLKEHLARTGLPVQKMMAFFLDNDLRERMRAELKAAYPELVVTSSVANNLEINARLATKGLALERLAAYLGLEMSQTMAFGDDINDVSMLRTAGVGVAMANASPEAVAAADERTLSCDENGVAAALTRLLAERDV